MPADFNQQIIEEFRAGNGRVGGLFEGARLILLTTTGARSGRPHTVPLGYLIDEERRVVIASAGGSPKHPAWYHNLLAHPRVTVEDGAFTYEADAVVLEGEERDRVFARAVEADPGWAEYEAESGRTLPVVALEFVTGGPNAHALGEGLKAVHDAFRRELAILRREVAEAGPRLGAQLRVNCLAFCQGLHHHHTIEDAQTFPFLGERHPELAATLARLRAEHVTVQRLLERLQELVSAGDADPRALLPEVERLSAELKAHLDYEEEQLVQVLNGVRP
ncbi:nitroreductase/quinone reductase family protein [Thermomonospora amylolytica]|uniref:nitroreductase/quinone reductase family protein n=1 Tax=Thermomonospora amylolytica TaxID=1411117 RepID=UPI000E6C7585|nr:nitroreductase/quinone reductase family protein [Thermomonospora amylolytica]